MKDSESCSRGNVFIVVFRNGGGGGVREATKELHGHTSVERALL